MSLCSSALLLPRGSVPHEGWERGCTSWPPEQALGRVCPKAHFAPALLEPPSGAESLFMRSSGVLGLWVASPSVNVGTGGQLGTHFVSWSGFPSSQDYIFHSSVLSVPEGHPCTTAVVPERQEVPLLPCLPLPDLPGTFGFLVTSLAWRRDQPHPAQTAGAVPTRFKGTEHFLAQAVLRGGSGEKVPIALLTGWKGGLGPLLCCPSPSIPRARTHMHGEGVGLIPDPARPHQRCRCALTSLLTVMGRCCWGCP